MIILWFLYASLHAKAPTSEKAQLLSVQTTAKQGKDVETKVTELTFIFVGKPSAYFHSIQQDPMRLVVEFYDCWLGDTKIGPLNQMPFKGLKTEEAKVNLNKDLEGMAPEWKDMLRATLELEKPVAYEASDDFNVVTFTCTYETGIKLARPEKGRAKRWMIPTIGGIAAGGVGAILYIFFSPPKDTTVVPRWYGDRRLPPEYPQNP